MRPRVASPDSAWRAAVETLRVSATASQGRSKPGSRTHCTLSTRLMSSECQTASSARVPKRVPINMQDNPLSRAHQARALRASRRCAPGALAPVRQTQAHGWWLCAVPTGGAERRDEHEAPYHDHAAREDVGSPSPASAPPALKLAHSLKASGVHKRR